MVCEYVREFTLYCGGKVKLSSEGQEELWQSTVNACNLDGED